MPSIRNFKKTGGLYYDPEEIKKYEILILEQLDYKLDYLTCYDMITSIMNHGIFIEKRFLKDFGDFTQGFIKDFYTLSILILEELISEKEIFKFSQLQLGCSCLMLASLFKFNYIEIEKLLFDHLKFDSQEIKNAFSEIKK